MCILDILLILIKHPHISCHPNLENEIFISCPQLKNCNFAKKIILCFVETKRLFFQYLHARVVSTYKGLIIKYVVMVAELSLTSTVV